jgi:hypothetical protein
MLFDDDLAIMRIEYNNEVRIFIKVNHEGQENFSIVLFSCSMYAKISLTKMRAPQRSSLG